MSQSFKVLLKSRCFLELVAVDLSSLIGFFLGAVFRIWKHRNIEHEKRAHEATCQSTASHKNVETLPKKPGCLSLAAGVCLSGGILTTGLPLSGKNENFSRLGKSQGKSLILSKSVKSWGILFSGLYIVHKFSSRLWNAFSFGEDEKWVCCKASKAINLTLYAWLM